MQWLVGHTANDWRTSEAIARGGKAPELRVALEIDIGLRRGGFEPGDCVSATRWTTLAERSSNSLSFSGLMGYEPHLTHAARNCSGFRKAAQRQACPTSAIAPVS